MLQSLFCIFNLVLTSLIKIMINMWMISCMMPAFCLGYNHCWSDTSLNYYSKNDVCASLWYGAGSSHISQKLTSGYEFCRQRSHRVKLSQGILQRYSISSTMPLFFIEWSGNSFDQPWSWIHYRELSEDTMFSHRCAYPISEFLNWSQPWLPGDPKWTLPQQSNDGPVQWPWPACISAEHYTWNPHPLL